ncbi:tryptophan synthase beta subunit-like PLP-dependent enzyme [Limtongia smithiae]|uniref:tryptophan synthase beta subunit-like PLP-dependent enzyme n=1 Tax=Limtongia smithiae TaxID=1125753 RepID=UPI0034CF66B5
MVSNRGSSRHVERRSPVVHCIAHSAKTTAAMATVDKPYIQTPLIRSPHLSKLLGCNVLLKLELLQPSGSFKSRGVGNLVYETYLASLSTSAATTISQRPTIFCSSAGNAGCAAAEASQRYGCPCVVVVPTSTGAHIVSRLRDEYDAHVVMHGNVWKQADDEARRLLAEHIQSGGTGKYCPPFDDPLIWRGNSTLVDEVLAQLREQSGSSSNDLASLNWAGIVCAVGGGGLYAGIIEGLQRHFDNSGTPGPAVIASETVGASKLYQSLQHRKRVVLPKISTIASSLGADAVAETAFELARSYNRTIPFAVTDAQAVSACLSLLDQYRLLVEPACGAALAVCYYEEHISMLKRELELKSDDTIVIVVCGGSTVTLESLQKYKEQFCS